MRQRAIIIAQAEEAGMHEHAARASARARYNVSRLGGRRAAMKISNLRRLFDAERSINRRYDIEHAKRYDALLWSEGVADLANPAGDQRLDVCGFGAR
jgi:hypothetical protein